jgi:anti-sigma regulatory factor (Ser/Thr protein kinase)
MPTAQRNFNRHLDSRAMVSNLIDEFTADKRVDEQAKNAVSVAVDELFTNLVKYKPANKYPITVELRADGGTLTVHLIERDVDRCGAGRKGASFTGSLLDQQTPASISLFQSRRLMDDVQYRYGDGTSLIILKKRFQRHYV